MFEKDLEELNNLSKNDLFGKKYYLENGKYLSFDDDCFKLIEEAIKKNEFDVFSPNISDIDISNKSLNDVVLTMYREESFIKDEMDVNVENANRYFPLIYHLHEYLEIECVFSGTATHFSLINEAKLKENDIVIIPPKTRHGLFVIEDSTVVIISIRKSTFERAFKDIIESNNQAAKFFRNAMIGEIKHEIIIRNGLDAFLKELILMIHSQLKYKNNNSSKINNHLIKSFIYYLAEHNTDENITTTYKTCKKSISDIQDYMFENYNTITLKDLADHFFYTPSHLSVIIKENFGTNYSELLQKIKLEKSKELLKKTDLSISDVGNMIGYDNESYYINLFKKRYGITPFQYRKKKAIK